MSFIRPLVWFATLTSLLQMGTAWAVPAVEPPLNAFFGTYYGVDITEKLETIGFGVKERDLDVQLAPIGNDAFKITWTMIQRDGRLTGAAEAQRRAVTLSFAPAGHTGVFRVSGTGAPFAGGAAAWASISGATLTVFTMSIEERGGFELQSYAWTLTEVGMLLEVSRVRDGEQVLFMRGLLQRAAN